MALNQRFSTSAALYMLVLSLVLLADVGQCSAQATPPPPYTYGLEANDLKAGAASSPGLTDQTTPSDSQAQTTGATPANASAGDDAWHIAVSPYLWLPGVHGIVGARGYDLNVHATAGDLLSKFRFGLMGAVELRQKRLLLPMDMVWVRLGDTKAVPFPDVGATSANITASEFILTPKIGVRLIDNEKLKIDALTGFRYWHLGESLNFSPSILGLNFSASQNWVDPLVGGRIQAALSPKVVVNILGDVGGWGTGSQLDYQVAGLLGYKIRPNLTLQAGYRYLDVDYRSGGSIFDVATSGALFGVTINLK